MLLSSTWVSKKKRLVKEIVWKTTTMCTKRFTHLMTITMPLRSTFPRGLQKVFSCDQGLSLASAQRSSQLCTKKPHKRAKSIPKEKRKSKKMCDVVRHKFIFRQPFSSLGVEAAAADSRSRKLHKPTRRENKRRWGQGESVRTAHTPANCSASKEDSPA